MVEESRTHDSLLLRIADANDGDAWRQFVAIYEPVVYRIARQKGMQDADAHDVVQYVMAAVARSIDRWQSDTSRASFRTWLYRVANNAFVDFIRKRRPDAAAGGSSVIRILDEQPDHEALAESTWEHEHRREVFRWAARRIRKEFSESTWAAFTMTTIGDTSPAATAEKLGMTVGSVYTARSRVMRRLKEEVQSYG